MVNLCILRSWAVAKALIYKILRMTETFNLLLDGWISSFFRRIGAFFISKDLITDIFTLSGDEACSRSLMFHFEISVCLSEMVESMKKVASMDVELTVEERNLLSVAYKNVIGARRASWRIISSLEQKEENKGGEDKLKMIREYRKTVRHCYKHKHTD